jgi:aspartate kinase
MHEAAVFPVRKAGIMMNIRNTNSPEDPGTLIASELPRVPRKHKVTGIAGMKGFTSILVEDSSMNDQVGYGMKLLGIFARHNIPFEHLPTGIDTMSVVVRTALFDPCRNLIMDEIRDEIGPELLFVEDHLAMIAVVGQGMAYSKGTAARIMKALSDARINIRMIDQGSSEINIIICVDEEDYENAIRSIYNEIEFTL